MSRITFLMVVHNGAQFVRPSIESVLNQSERDLTFYIKNNGSQDNSIDIIKEYANADPRVKWMENKTNNIMDDGTSFYERNWWPEFSSKYVAIVDHDDILDVDFAKIMCDAADAFQADFVISGCTFFEDETNRYLDSRIPPALAVEEMSGVGKYFQDLYGTLRTQWGKVYKTSFFDQYYEEVRKVPDDLRLCRDTFYIMGYLEKCHRFVSIDRVLYYYREKKESGFHSPVIQHFRVKEADILFERALKCLESLHINTNENILFLYAVHWGHMVDLINLLISSQAMSIEDKLDIIQAILENTYLKRYLDSSFKTIWNIIRPVLAQLMPDIHSISARLYEHYIVRLYTAFKEGEDEPSDFPAIFSAAKNAANINHFGLHLLSDIQGHLSPMENHFKRLPMERQKKLLENQDELSDLLPWNLRQEVDELEKQLSEADEREDYSAAQDILNKIYAINPFSEYAIYYKIYLLALSEADSLALRQSYQARDIWPHSMEIEKLCQYVQSAPVIPIQPHMEYQFGQKLLNMHPAQLKSFSFFLNIIRQTSFLDLMTLSFAFHLRQKTMQTKGKIYPDKKDVLKFANNTSVREGLDDNADSVFIMQAIREMKKNVDRYEWLYHQLGDMISQNKLHDIMLYRFTGNREYLKGCMAGSKILATEGISLSDNLESLWSVPAGIREKNNNLSMALHCRFVERHMTEIILNYR